jgi:peptide/nickel transport system substrate-binding protein
MLLRRNILQAAGALLASPAIAASETARVLRFMPQADLASLDPIWTTNYQTLYHGCLIFDTLFGVDGKFQPQPQMALGAATEDAGRIWRITLRDGLIFHDGERVLARDCAASIRRWGARDAFGQALLAATDEISAPDDRTILIRLRRPFPLLPDALGKMTPHMCFIMPERLAATDPYKQVSDMVGSGPYRFKPDERIPGARLVYERNSRYVPRPDGKADGIAGPKVAYFDRVEWNIIPDPSTAAVALQQGEIDWWQAPVPDLLPLLRKNEKLKVELLNPTGSIATLRFNHLNLPFNNAAMRRAILGAIDQSEHGIAVMGPDPSGWRDRVGFFCPDTPMASDAGMEALTGRRDLNAARRAIQKAGYQGEKIVVLWPTNEPILKALADVTIDTLKKLDLNIDAQAMDWSTVMQRRNKTEPVEQGGWSLFDTSWPGRDMLIPVGHVYLRGNGRSATAGWPESPNIEAQCNEWLLASDLPTQKAIAEKLQLQAFEDVPYIPLCQYFLPVAYQKNLQGVLKGNPVFWNVRRTV